MQLAAVDETGAEVLAVTVAGQPEVAVGSPVVVEDLVAIPWTQGERSGVAYRAGSVRSGGTPLAGFGASGPKPASAHSPVRQVA